MASKKSAKAPVLNEELAKALESISASAGDAKTVTEDDIQVAIREIDVDGDELSDLYDAIRARGIDITTAGEDSLSPELMAAIDGDAGDDDSVFEDDLDQDEPDPDTAEAKAAEEIMEPAPKPKKEEEPDLFDLLFPE